MQALEAIDQRDRLDATPRQQRLRQIPPVTGKFLALIAANAPQGDFVEIGTSAGYSTLWLSLAGRRLTTYELLPEKASLARQTFHLSAVEHLVELVEGDALAYLERHEKISFCFVDAEKEIYAACYDLVVPRLVPGGILAADNASSHRAELEPLLERARLDARIDSLVVPVGKGVLLCRKI
jgi:predicted O-methyltransferase YrrM